MGISIVPFEPRHAAALRRFAEVAQSRPCSEEFFAWRYLECPSRSCARLVIRDDECLAMLGVFEKSWYLGGEVVPVIETHDWLCRPDLLRSGLGVRLMRTLMDEGKPIIAVGGTAATLSLLPRLGWSRIGSAKSFVLPLQDEQLATQIRERIRVPRALARVAAGVAVRTWFRPGSTRPPPGAAVVPLGGVDEETESLFRGEVEYGLAYVPEGGFLRWLMAGQGSWRFLPFHFLREGRLCGWALAAVGRMSDGVQARVLEVFAPQRDPTTYAWMIREITARLAAFAPARIEVQSTCEVVQAALRRNRFLELAEVPVQFWPGAPGRPLPRPPFAVGRLTADDPLRPYPERWPVEPAALPVGNAE